MYFYGSTWGWENLQKTQASTYRFIFELTLYTLFPNEVDVKIVQIKRGRSVIMMKHIQTKLTRNTFLFLALIACFLVMSSISHAVTIELSEAPSSWLPKFDNTVSIKVTIKGNLHSHHTVVFNLSEVTNWPGISMNYGLITSRAPDLVLYSTDQQGAGITWRNRGTAAQSLSAAFTTNSESRKTFAVKIRSYDYGAFGKLSAQLYGSGGESSSPLNSAGPITIPLDKNGNRIADGWMYDTSRNYSPSADNESGPSGNSSSGDGFTVFEEYRGFEIKGTHTRTTPFDKDLFIYSIFSSEGVGYATKLRQDTGYIFKVHSIYQSEMNSRRVMNSRKCPGYWKMDQKAVKVLKDTTRGPISYWAGHRRVNLGVIFGYAFTDPQSFQGSYIPSQALSATVYTSNIEDQLDDPGETISTSEAIKKIIAHEVAHHISLDHASSGLMSTLSTAGSLSAIGTNYPLSHHAHEYRLVP